MGDTWGEERAVQRRSFEVDADADGVAGASKSRLTFA